MDNEQIQIQISTLSQEFEQLRNSIRHSFQLNIEIDDIRRKRKIPTETNFSILNLLILELKPEISRELYSLCIESSDDIKALKTQIHDQETEINLSKEEIDRLLSRSAKIEEDLRFATNRCAELKSEFTILDRTQSEIIKDMATSQQLGELKSSLNKYATMAKYRELKQKVSECAQITDVDSLKREQERVKTKFKKYINKEKTEKLILESKNDIISSMNDLYCTKDSLETISAEVNRFLSKSDDRIKGLAESSAHMEAKIRELHRSFKDQIGSKPWKDELQAIIKDLEGKASIEELKYMQDEVGPIIAGFKDTIEKYNKRLNETENILERFDEILLEKSSKDDIRELKSIIELAASKTDFHSLLEKHKEESAETRIMLQQIAKKTDESKEQINHLAYKFEILKRDNHDVSQISYTLQAIQEQIDKKAEKSEIEAILEEMGRKNDLINLEIFSDRLKRQLEMSSVLMHSMCRTLLKSGEPPTVIRKQRFDLYRYITSLVNWISGEGGSPRNSISLTSKFAETQVRVDMNQTTFDMYSPPPTVRISKIRRTSAATVSPSKYHSLDLPPLKQT
ncbi:unnamed protein product [Blepharisma stoltei]|uniref:Uncharacterized protein n=1 Tax=Blepharisma stoltei TaxID=1481888 RepID=A0AAU9JX15_9CILI|nr:unnamed protein product [Blepharisma stoltei]